MINLKNRYNSTYLLFYSSARRLMITMRIKYDLIHLLILTKIRDSNYNLLDRMTTNTNIIGGFFDVVTSTVY